MESGRPSDSVTIIVAWYGEETRWAELAARAAHSAAQQQANIVLKWRGPTLHEARNEALEMVVTKYVIFLDADDELSPGYVDAMLRGTAQIRAPMVAYITGGSADPPAMPHVYGHTHLCDATCLPYGNWLVIGAMAETQLLRDVGGFHDYPVYEDWDLWARCAKYGATFETIKDAVYLAHVQAFSRNRSLTPIERHRVHQQIARDNGFPVPP